MIKNIYRYGAFAMLIAFSGVVEAKKNNHTEGSINLFSATQYFSKAKLLYTQKKRKKRKQLIVTATAYTSHVGQTDSTPNIAAWGDRLRPGMKVIAVSRDLLTHYRLKRGSMVKISGLSGRYKVLDKMNKRWRKKIDIYMGKNKKRAFKWGRKKVVIEWVE